MSSKHGLVVLYRKPVYLFKNIWQVSAPNVRYQDCPCVPKCKGGVLICYAIKHVKTKRRLYKEEEIGFSCFCITVISTWRQCGIVPRGCQPPGRKINPTSLDKRILWCKISYYFPLVPCNVNLVGIRTRAYLHKETVQEWICILDINNCFLILRWKILLQLKYKKILT